MARKYYLTMKTPDVLESIIEDAIKDEKEVFINKRLDAKDIVTDEELEDIEINVRDEIQKLSKKWFNYGESVTLVLDLDAKTLTVQEK